MMYVRFPLSLRNGEDLLHERGIEVSHETIRLWWNRFGPIFAADKLHNARSILSDYRNLGEEIWQRFVTRKEGTLWYYRSVLNVLIQAGRTPLVDELDRVVSELERLARQAPDS